MIPADVQEISCQRYPPPSCTAARAAGRSSGSGVVATSLAPWPGAANLSSPATAAGDVDGSTCMLLQRDPPLVRISE